MLMNFRPERRTLKLERCTFLTLCPTSLTSLTYPNIQCLTVFLVSTHSWSSHQGTLYGSENRPVIVDAAPMMVFWVLYPQRTNSLTLQTMAAHSSEMLEQSHYILRVYGGNIATEGNMTKWPLRNGVMCVTTDGICSMSGRLGSICLW